MKHPMNEVLAEAYTQTLRDRGRSITSSQVPQEFRLLPDPRDPFITDVLKREQEIIEHLEWSKR